MEELVLVKYQDDFAKNLTSYAYSKILEKKYNLKCFWENNPVSRKNFESKMDCFSLSCSYISSVRAHEIAKRANEKNKIYLDKRKYKKNKVINKTCFSLDDYQFLTGDILKELCFENINFIKNYDILEEINAQNSIGVYISEKDLKENSIDINYITQAAKRLNKYLKRPVLYIFSKEKKLNLNLDIEYKILNIDDYKEEFFLLKSCKHKIILSNKNSYPEGFWASTLSKYQFGYVIYDKTLNPKHKIKNWIGV